MKIGVLGGTFDPPHKGHLAIARAALEQLELDEVLFVPARQNPLKLRRPGATARQRLEMVRLATDGESGFAVSDQELSRDEKSYTVDTLSELQAIRPADYWLIIGFDSLLEFPKWRSPERIVKLARIACYNRGDGENELQRARVAEWLPSYVDFLESTPIDISSTDIRRRIDERKPWGHLVEPSVRAYIEEHNLYSKLR